MSREIKQVNIDQGLIERSKIIVDEFRDFTDGINLLLLIYRAKEGAQSANNDKLRKVIVRNREEYQKTVLEMLVDTRNSGLPYRIYASCAPRDVEKAIRKFKYEQLDAEYFGEKDRQEFYLDVKNRWFGCLAMPGSAAETRFLIDLDSREEETECLKIIGNNDMNDMVLKHYFTKNGSHIVMKPFDPKRLEKFAQNIHKDGLLLLNY